MMIYIVQEFIYGKWCATIGAYTLLENAFKAIERIMKEEQLRQKDFFTEGTSPFTEYWLITNGIRTFEIQTISLNS